MKVNPAIEDTEDGSQTLLHPVFGDSYHSLKGARGESLYVFIQEGLRVVMDCIGRPQTCSVKVLEVGLGSCLNAWLTAVEAAETGVQVEYTGVELYPVDEQTLLQLDYASDRLYRDIVTASWEEPVTVSEYFTIKKIASSLQESHFDTIFDLVYFDAFAYDTQPEMWSSEVFGKIAAAMRPGAVLVTYSAKGVVKENLRKAGFEVKRLPGALGKRHMLRAVKL